MIRKPWIEVSGRCRLAPAVVGVALVFALRAIVPLEGVAAADDPARIYTALGQETLDQHLTFSRDLKSCGRSALAGTDAMLRGTRFFSCQYGRAFLGDVTSDERGLLPPGGKDPLVPFDATRFGFEIGGARWMPGFLRGLEGERGWGVQVTYGSLSLAGSADEAALYRGQAGWYFSQSWKGFSLGGNAAVGLGRGVVERKETPLVGQPVTLRNGSDLIWAGAEVELGYERTFGPLRTGLTLFGGLTDMAYLTSTEKGDETLGRHIVQTTNVIGDVGGRFHLGTDWMALGGCEKSGCTRVAPFASFSYRERPDERLTHVVTASRATPTISQKSLAPLSDKAVRVEAGLKALSDRGLLFELRYAQEESDQLTDREAHLSLAIPF